MHHSHVYYRGFGNDTLLHILPKAEKPEANQGRLSESPMLATRALLEQMEQSVKFPRNSKWQREGKLVSWFSQTHSERISARQQGCAEQASWGFREDYTISKDKPIKPHPTRSHPFPDAATDFCQGGVEKQKN